MIRLGVNVDHVATVRNARRAPYPDPAHAAMLAETAGAHNITAHLREDRRHINERDIKIIKEVITIPLNLEIASTSEMISFAKTIRPHAVTLVPEKREELTTEGGLNLESNKTTLERHIAELNEAGILVSLFVEADERVFETSLKLGAKAVEIHTGRFCEQIDSCRATEDQRKLVESMNQKSNFAHDLGLQVHFGHGLHYGNAHWLQKITHAEEANIGHAIVARSIYVGFDQAVKDMLSLLNDSKHLPN